MSSLTGIGVSPGYAGGPAYRVAPPLTLPPLAPTDLDPEPTNGIFLACSAVACPAP